MKVLFLGDYSGLHWTLAQGLRSLGHEAFVSASGDGFKAMRFDKRLCIEGGGPWRSLRRKWMTFSSLPEYSGYDVVQLINPFVFGKKGYNRWYVKQLKKRNGKVVLTAAGDDPIVAARALSGGMRYSFFHAALACDFPSREYKDISRMLNQNYILENLRILDQVDAVIPFAYEYTLGYSAYAKCTAVLPYPLDPAVTKPLLESSPDAPLRILHGMSRSVFKGSQIIAQGMRLAKKSHGDAIAITIADRMPYDEYVKALDQADVLMDQCNSYSYAMNALIGMGMHKIVGSGAEPECLKAFGVFPGECPILNIRPDPNQIAEAISKLIGKRSQVISAQKESYAYALRHHKLSIIARRHLKLLESL